MLPLFFTTDGAQPPYVDPALLAEISGWRQPNEHMSWLELVWHRDPTDTTLMSGRWVFYQVFPVEATPHIAFDTRHTHNRLWKEDGRWREKVVPFEHIRPVIQDEYLNLYQREIYRHYGRYSEPYYVVQGFGGGHKCRYEKWEEALLVESGREPRPPKIGELPFAAIDARTIRNINFADLYVGEMSKHIKKDFGEKGRLDGLRDWGKDFIAQSILRHLDVQLARSLDEAEISRRKLGELSEYSSSAPDMQDPTEKLNEAVEDIACIVMI